jgi:hypothetical protein
MAPNHPAIRDQPVPLRVSVLRNNPDGFLDCAFSSVKTNHRFGVATWILGLWFCWLGAVDRRRLFRGADRKEANVGGRLFRTAQTESSVISAHGTPPSSRQALTSKAAFQTEGAMTTTPNHNLKDDARSVRSVLHSRVYLLLVGFALWFALAVWGFAGGGLSNYLLVIVSGFISIVVALQLILSRVDSSVARSLKT